MVKLPVWLMILSICAAVFLITKFVSVISYCSGNKGFYNGMVIHSATTPGKF
jgi:hypothetical protein